MYRPNDNREFKNLTPHAVVIYRKQSALVDHATITIPPSGTIARVGSSDEPCETLGGFIPFHGNVLVDTVRTVYGEVAGLPAPCPNTILIVSGMVAQHSPREDVFSPGPLVRDSEGRPIGCVGLRSSLQPLPSPCGRCGSQKRESVCSCFTFDQWNAM